MIIRKEISRYLANEFSTIRSVLSKIDSNEDGIVFCVDDRGLLLGVLTDGDLRRWLISVSVPDLEQPRLRAISQDRDVVRRETLIGESR